MVVTSTAIQVGVLGPLRVVHRGSVVELGSPKQRAVLALLAAEPRRILSRDLLLEGIWGEEDAAGRANSLYTYISNLRALLGDVILREGSSYRLDISPESIDATRFEEAVVEAHRSLTIDPSTTADRLRTALSWWRGRPFAGLDDVPGLAGAIRRLEELRLEAVELRIDADLAIGRHGALIAEAEALAAEHPLRERFRAQHMIALYRAGRQAEALRAYRETERYLGDELGLEPSEELKALELSILQHDAALGAGTARGTTQRLAVLAAGVDVPPGAWDIHPGPMAEALAVHDAILEETVESRAGRMLPYMSDMALAVFPDAAAAAAAAGAALQALAATDWGEVGELLCRVGIDVGEVDVREDELSGPPRNRAERLCAVAHGGQILVSAAAMGELSGAGDAGTQVKMLGIHRLPGMADAEQVGQLVLVGIPADFPRLRLDAGAPAGPPGLPSLPGYEVRERMGEGAFGVVWRAYQPSVGREVAIKVIRPGLAGDPVFIRRFEAEARTIARLAHPHIVPLFDFWRDAGGAYLVLQLLEGGALSDRLLSGPVPERAALRILDQVGAALDHTHAQGIAHGDVKPSNVLLDRAGNAYLSDIGIAARLLEPGLVASVAATPEYRAPEEAVTGPAPAADRYAFGVLAAALLPDAGETQPVLARAASPLPEHRYPSAAAFLADLHGTLGSGAEPDAAAPVARNPFKGLRAFEEGDTADFYGRDALVADLVAAVARHRFVAVVGPSGSGKSSVVQAGLLPALAAGAVPGSEDWFRLVITPGPAPLAALAEAMERLAACPVDPEKIAERGLAATIAELSLGDDPTVLVVIDQMEELYTLADQQGERDGFVDSLIDAAADRHGRVRVVATLRADFYDRPLDSPLGPLVRDGLVTVLPPTDDELVEMITAPSRAVGLRWEAGLPHRIAHDVAGQPGGLPLLQYSLTELVERRSGSTLTGGEYERVGGVTGALAARAEAIYAGLEPSRQEATRQILLRLVTVDEDTGDTRRRVRRTELESLGIARTDVEHILDTLIAERLLLTDRDPVTRGPTVEVAHEALLREWPRLTRWVDDQRESLILGRRFRSAMADWEAAGRDPDYLLTGSRLAPYLGWAESSALTAEERDFFQVSVTETEMESARRRKRRARILTGFAVAATIAAVLAIVAFVQAARAGREADRATAEAQVARGRELAAAAQGALATDPSVAKLLAVSAADLIEPNVDVMSMLHQSFAADRVIDRYSWPVVAAYHTVDLHPDGTRIVASSTLPGPSGYMEVHDFETDETVWRWDSGHPEVVVDTARYTPDGNRVVAGVYWWPPVGTEGRAPAGVDLGVHFWHADSGELQDRIDIGPCGGKVVDLSVDRLLVATVDPANCGIMSTPFSRRGRLEVIDMTTGDRRELAPDADWRAAISDDGRIAAFVEYTETGDAVSAVVALDDNERLLEFNPNRPSGSVYPSVLNRDGSLLVVGSRPLEVWDVVNGRLAATFGGHEGASATAWAFSADGEAVYSTGVDFSLRVWDPHRGVESASHPGVGASTAALGAGDRVIVAQSGPVQASLLDLTPGELWGIAGCGGAVTGQSLDLVGEVAVFNERCPDGSRYTRIVDVARRQVARSDMLNYSDVAISRDGTRYVHQERTDAPPGAVETSESIWLSPPRIRDLATGELLVELSGVCTWDWESYTSRWEQPGCAPDLEGDAPIPLYNQQLTWSPDSAFVAALFRDRYNGIVAWDAETGEKLALIGSPCRFEGPVRILFSPASDEMLFSCIGDGSLFAYSTATWQQTRATALPEDTSGRQTFALFAYNPQGTEILGVGGTGLGSEAQLHWLDAGTLEVVHTVPNAHTASASAWVVSSDGSLAATGSHDGFVRVWDVAERRLLQEIRAGQQIQGLAFVDHEHLAVTVLGGGFYVYTLDPGELLGIVRDSLTRGFTETECARYNFGDECPTLEELRSGTGS